MNVRFRFRFYTATLVALCIISGCAKPGPAKTLPPPVLPSVQTDNPESTARSALMLMQNELRAIAARDSKEASRIHKALLGIVARRDAEKALKNVSGAKSLLGDDVVSGMVELWTAAIAHYSEGIDFSTLAGTQGLKTNEVSVYVTAKSKNDSAFLRVDCVKEDNRWFIGNFAIDPAGPPRGGAVVQIPISASAPSKIMSPPSSQPAHSPK